MNENMELLSLNFDDLTVEELEERLELAGAAAACASCAVENGGASLAAGC